MGTLLDLLANVGGWIGTSPTLFLFYLWLGVFVLAAMGILLSGRRWTRGLCLAVGYLLSYGMVQSGRMPAAIFANRWLEAGLVTAGLVLVGWLWFRRR